MKKITLQLVVASIFLVGSLAKASENPVFSDNTVTRKFNSNEPIAFVERGISFYVFQNGDFDFNTRPEDSDGDYYYKTAGSRAENNVNRRPQNYGIKIEHDSFGRVRRVGNTFINYDFSNRVSRIGTVYMRYNRFALTQVGGLRIVYNRRGQIVDVFGSVKNRYNDNCNNVNQNNYSYSSGYQLNTNDDFDNNDYSNNDYYYYKTDGSKARIEESEENKVEKNQVNK